MKKLITLGFFIIFFLFTSSNALAVEIGTPLEGSGCLITPDGGAELGKVVTIDCFPIILSNIILWLLIFTGAVALIMLILSGYKFLASGGDPKQAEGAKKTLTFAIIGMILIFLSFAIVTFLGKTTGVACLNTRFGFEKCYKVRECTTRAECPSPRIQRCSNGQCINEGLD